MPMSRIVLTSKPLFYRSDTKTIGHHGILNRHGVKIFYTPNNRDPRILTFSHVINGLQNALMLALYLHTNIVVISEGVPGDTGLPVVHLRFGEIMKRIFHLT